MRQRYAIIVALAAILAGSSFLPLGGTVLGSWAAYGWWKWVYNLPGSGNFVKVAPDVYSWSQGYASQLATAVKRQLPKKAALDTILLTHAHLDHTGALPQLLRAYPSAGVVIHEREWPFLAGTQSYYPPNSLVVRTAQALGAAPRGQVQVDKGRVHQLRGSSGDLTAQGISSLTWVATPGHSPGHVSYLHIPSGCLIAGDAIINVWPSLAMDAGLGSLLAYPLRKFGRGGAMLTGLVGSGLLRVLPRALTDLVPAPVLQLLDGTLLGGGPGPGPGRVKHEHVISSGASVVGGAGDEASEGTVVLGGRVQGQPAGQVKVPYTWALPRVVVNVKPMLICPHPTCDEHQGHKSICQLASLKFETAVLMHDATERGLSHSQLADFSSSLPACRP